MDRATDKEHDCPMTRVHTMLSEFERWLRRKDGKEIVSEGFLGTDGVEVEKFKALVK